MNENNKGTTILLTVIGVATLLVAVVGATFAYFTANVKDVNPDKTDVNVSAATVGTITFTHGDTITLQNAYPGDLDSKTFTIAADATSTIPVEYNIYLTVTNNTFITNNLEYKLSATSVTGTNGTASTGLPTLEGSQYVALDSTTYGNAKKVLIGTAKLGTKGTVDTWTMEVRLKETNELQNDDQGKEFSGKLSVEAVTKYSAGGNTYGG